MSLGSKVVGVVPVGMLPGPKTFGISLTCVTPTPAAI